ncbi:hypothetical protein GALL_318870 [mine drainage metagenome]|uniref:Uncharacterized protein n=1 Tax=mine drainage metagenome TaxID=410659 RepID=A0A1J5QRK8_9ZZZZ
MFGARASSAAASATDRPGRRRTSRSSSTWAPESVPAGNGPPPRRRVRRRSCPIAVNRLSARTTSADARGGVSVASAMPPCYLSLPLIQMYNVLRCRMPAVPVGRLCLGATDPPASEHPSTIGRPAPVRSRHGAHPRGRSGRVIPESPAHPEERRRHDRAPAHHGSASPGPWSLVIRAIDADRMSVNAANGWNCHACHAQTVHRVQRGSGKTIRPLARARMRVRALARRSDSRGAATGGW